MMEEMGTIQDLLTMHDFYMIDAKVEEVARALGLARIWGLDRDVCELKRRTAYKSPYSESFCLKSRISLLLGRTDQLL